MRQSWTVYYRTGGTENFKWHRALPVAGIEAAREQLQEVRRMGYTAYYAPTNHLDAIGLPETFE